MSNQNQDFNRSYQEAEAQKVEAFAKLAALSSSWYLVGLSSRKAPQKPTNIHVNLKPFYQ